MYFVTACTSERLPLLDSEHAAVIVFSELRQLEADDSGLQLIASVVMPDHLHALLRLGETQPLETIMRLFRGRSARAVNKRLNRTGSLWQRGFFEHVFRPDESLEPVLHYMWHNPNPPGRHFRCRADVWLWFKSCVTKEVTYFDWLSRNPMGDRSSQ